MKKIKRRDFVFMMGTAPMAWGSRHLGKEPGSPAPQKKTVKTFDPWLEIDTANLTWNIAQVRKRVEGRPIMAVVKCNAYGHGLVETAQHMAGNGIGRFAVVKVHEAAALRENGIKGEILNFGPYSETEAETLVNLGISQSVFTGSVRYLSDASRSLNKKARIHIKVDTGLGRVGVPHEKALDYIEKTAALPGITIEGIFTTLTEETDFDRIQVERLCRIAAVAKKMGVSTGLRHAASSLPLANYPGSFLDMVRPGNALYGLEPLANMDLRPVMSFKTRVILIKKMSPGQTLSYHGRYKIHKDMLLATLPLGYSDGYPFQAVNKAEVLIRGKRFSLIADMSANHSYADISGYPDIGIGDEVVLFGEQNGQKITLDEVAKWGESSVYKVPILMNPLLQRFYH
ncbi:MAG: alanine racemase [Candidatus Aminicenantes bacterium]|nr:alanine racemase [Candidatus Aminicenantes bacterium]